MSARLQANHSERQRHFVVIEHQMEFVMALCTRVLVLAEGRVIAEGTPQDIRRNPAVIDAYLGHKVSAPMNETAPILCGE